jgi:ribonuclease D
MHQETPLMKPFIAIDSPAQLQTLVSELASNRYLAIDTESNGYHAYHEQICLIQISTAARDYIVDPLAIGNIGALGAVLNDPAIEKIMHAASNDVSGLKRDFHFEISRLFDTALACKLLGFEQLGLSKIIQQHFGVELDKKWQRCDWGRRPLTAEQLHYARMDTHFLIELRHQLAAELRSRQLWERAQEVFIKACAQVIPERAFDPQGYKRIHGALLLDHSSRQLLRALYLYRDRRARTLDRAPFRVLSNETLLRLALRCPGNLEELAAISGLPRPYRSGRLAQELLEVIRKSVHPADQHFAANHLQHPGSSEEHLTRENRLRKHHGAGEDQ